MSFSSACSKLKALLTKLNIESQQRLVQIRGLGPTTVAKILRERNSGKPLGIREVMAIPGVGPKLLATATGDPLIPFIVRHALYYLDVVNGVSHKVDLCNLGHAYGSFQVWAGTYILRYCSLTSGISLKFLICRYIMVWCMIVCCAI